PKMRAFFCLGGTRYIYLSLSRRSCGLLTPTGSGSQAAWYPHKRESLDRAAVRHKEECDGTHAHRPETRVFQRRPAKVGIIGCGYVGLPLALRFAEAGHKV